ncbi:MAG: hypothetical protein N3A55_05640, partial [Methylohalobius sp.]|nr:hypothetical protein [Methylohalobius sp.]
GLDWTEKHLMGMVQGERQAQAAVEMARAVAGGADELRRRPILSDLIGTVSPAGGNFEEPVTQATLATVKAFLGLSADRAYKRAYPAIDPLLSWSRYLEQLRPWFERQLPGWTAKVEWALALLRRGEAVYQMMQVTGEEGVSLEDFVIYQKAWLLDIAYLQQNAYDPVDVSTPLERQEKVFSLLVEVLQRGYEFADKERARRFFLRVAELFRNLNYAPTDSDAFSEYLAAIQNLSEKSV